MRLPSEDTDGERRLSSDVLVRYDANVLPYNRMELYYIHLLDKRLYNESCTLKISLHTMIKQGQ